MAADPDAATTPAHSGPARRAAQGANSHQDNSAAAMYWTAALFALGCLAGVAGLLVGASTSPGGNVAGVGYGCEMVEIAKNVSASGCFGNPFESFPTGPTAFEPPLYPLALALAFRLFQSAGAVAVFAEFMAIAANALTGALLVRVSKTFFGTYVPGAFAGALSILAAQPVPCWDVNHTQLGLVLLVLAAAWLTQKATRPVWSGLAAGAIAGLLSLLNPATALVSALCAAFFHLRRRPAFGNSVRFAAAFIAAALAVNAPWLVRNYRLWGEFVVRTNFGVTLHESNSDCTAPSHEVYVASGCATALHPNGNASEARELARLGEPAYNRQKLAEAVAWIKSHPARFAELSGRRIIEFWFPYPKPWLRAACAVWLITALSIFGLVWMWQRREATGVLLTAVFAVYPLVYYVMVSDIRYRMPILWLSCLAAGYFLHALAAAFRGAVSALPRRVDVG